MRKLVFAERMAKRIATFIDLNRPHQRFEVDHVMASFRDEDLRATFRFIINQEGRRIIIEID
jgi:hypothetical protein